MAGKASLIIVIGYLVIFGIISGSLNRSGTDAVKNSAGYYDQIAAKSLVSSSIDLCLRKISQYGGWRDGFNNFSFAGGTFSCVI